LPRQRVHQRRIDALIEQAAEFRDHADRECVIADREIPIEGDLCQSERYLRLIQLLGELGEEDDFLRAVELAREREEELSGHAVETEVMCYADSTNRITSCP
jgi:hypothetical protein